jgi:hypothetical protein
MYRFSIALHSLHFAIEKLGWMQKMPTAQDMNAIGRVWESQGIDNVPYGQDHR